MKKIIVMSIIGIVLTACGDRDEDYFFKNQDKAKGTFKACEQKLYKALENGDEKEFKTIQSDEECKAADSALKKQRLINWEQEQAERERLKQLEEAAKRKEILDEKEKIEMAHQGNSWQQNISAYLKLDRCETHLWQAPSTECAAWSEFYKDAVNEGETILSSFSFEELKEKENTFCALDKRRGSACEVWMNVRDAKGKAALSGLDLFEIETVKANYCHQENSFSSICQTWNNAWRVKSDQLVAYYTNEDDAFMETYNLCMDEIESVQNSEGDWREKSERESSIKSMSPCSQAATAYQRRGMGYAPFRGKIVR